MRYMFIYVALMALCTDCFADPQADCVEETAAIKTSAEKKIKSIGAIIQNTLRSLASEEITEKNALSSFVSIFKNYFDTNYIARYLIGKTKFEELSEENKSEYMRLFAINLANTYFMALKQNYTPAYEFNILSSSVDPDGNVYVKTEIKRDGGDSIPVKWKVNKSGRVTSVSVANVRIEKAKKDDFSSALSSCTTFEEFLKELERSVVSSH